jgi:hypothetical protein
MFRHDKATWHQWRETVWPTVLSAGLAASGFTARAAASNSTAAPASETRSEQLDRQRGGAPTHHARHLLVPEAMSNSVDTQLARLHPMESALKRVLDKDESQSGPSVGWSDAFGTSGNSEVRTVAVVGQDLYAYGQTSVALPGESSAGGFDLFLRKYDVQGNLIWTRQFGTPGDDFAFGGVTMAAKDGAIYVAGLVPDALPGQAYAGGPFDAFLRKYDEDGVEVWTRQFGTEAADDIHGVAIEHGHVYVVGSTGATLPGQTYAGGPEDAFLRKYDADGNELWTRQFGTLGDDHAWVAAVDASGVYVGGLTDGTLPGQTSAGFVDAFIRKYSHKGRLKWTRQYGTAGFDEVTGIAAAGGAVYVHGRTDGALPGQSSAGGLDAYVRQYSVGGSERWTRQYGTPQADFGEMLAVHKKTVYLVGSTFGTFPGQTFSGVLDGFVRTYDARGNEGWTFQFGPAFAVGIEFSGPDSLFVGGGSIRGRLFEGTDGYVLQLLLDDDQHD